MRRRGKKFTKWPRNGKTVSYKITVHTLYATFNFFATPLNYRFLTLSCFALFAF